MLDPERRRIVGVVVGAHHEQRCRDLALPSPTRRSHGATRLHVFGCAEVLVFRDAAFSMAIDLARPKRQPGTDYRRTMFPEQIAVLERLNPEWARRCAAEHVEVLEQYPFVDGKGP